MTQGAESADVKALLKRARQALDANVLNGSLDGHTIRNLICDLAAALSSPSSSRWRAERRAEILEEAAVAVEARLGACRKWPAFMAAAEGLGIHNTVLREIAAAIRALAALPASGEEDT